MDDADLTVVDNPDRRRFEARIGDRVVGFSEYRTRPQRMTFTHTEVEPEYEGQGVGSRLVRGALDEARARGVSVAPLCPFVAEYIRGHPEYLDLVDSAHRSRLDQGSS
ncbi:MAG TPA: GNAT family N-acetyltransferase [Micromonosporaceae bacterium]